MTALVVVALCGFSVSLLTLFSGFGLGTLLLPAFAIFLPVEVAVASTAIVHAANNLFKVGLLARSIRRDILVRFGLPAACAALAGALTLVSISTQSGLATWSFLGRAAEVTPVKLVMGILILFFAAVELATPRREWGVSPRWLPVGGALSGFFGGLSGHQGAVRAVFLTPLRLSPVQFASTQAGLALLVGRHAAHRVWMVLRPDALVGRACRDSLDAGRGGDGVRLHRLPGSGRTCCRT